MLDLIKLFPACYLKPVLLVIVARLRCKALCTAALQGTRSAEHNFALALVRVDRQAIAAEPYSIAVARTACSTPCMAARASRSFPILTKAAKHEISSFIAIGNGKERAKLRPFSF